MHSENHKIYNLQELLAVSADTDRWIVPNTIPRRGHVMVYGEGSTFKSTVFFDLAFAVASGGLFLQRYPINAYGPVLIISTESSIEENAERVKALIRARELPSPEMTDRQVKGRSPDMAQRLRKTQFHFCQDAFYLDNPKEQMELEGIVAKLRPLLILVDPLDSFLSSGDENSATETRPFRQFFNRLRSRYGTTHIILHHANKGDRNRDPSLRGTGAWQGWADTVIYFRRQERTMGNYNVPTVQADSQKQRNGRCPATLFKVVPEFDESLRVTTFSPIEGDDSPELLLYGIARQSIVSNLHYNGAHSRGQLISATRLDPKAVDSALGFLEQAGLVSYGLTGEYQLRPKVSITDATVQLLQEQRKEALGVEARTGGYDEGDQVP